MLLYTAEVAIQESNTIHCLDDCYLSKNLINLAYFDKAKLQISLPLMCQDNNICFFFSVSIHMFFIGCSKIPFILHDLFYISNPPRISKAKEEEKITLRDYNGEMREGGV